MSNKGKGSREYRKDMKWEEKEIRRGKKRSNRERSGRRKSMEKSYYKNLIFSDLHDRNEEQEDFEFDDVFEFE